MLKSGPEVGERKKGAVAPPSSGFFGGMVGWDAKSRE
jgi:hypothetical protein